LVILAGCDTTPPATNSTTTTTTAPSGDSGDKKLGRPATTGAGNTVTGDTIPIGVVASSTGDQAPWGLDCVKGAQLAVDAANAAGGVNGKQIKLIPADDASKEEQGKSATEKLVDEDKVVAILGEVASGITLQMGPVCQDKGVPDVAVGATKTTLTDLGNVMFRVCYTDDLQGPVMANFAYKELKLKNVGVITDKKLPYSTGLSDAFKATFQHLGGTIVGEEFYEKGQTNFSGILTDLKSKNPQGVFASGYFTEVGPLVRQAAEAGLKIPFFGGDGWDSKEILKTGGDAILGDFFCNHYNNNDPRPEVQEFLKAWKAKNGDVPGTTMGALGYDAAAIVIDALKKSKTLSSLDLRDALDNEENFHGVSGDITLKGNNGNPPKRAVVVKLTPQGQVFAKGYEASEVTK
jgi:branched-chain amino acid transport system substrate-binding protein